MSAESIEPVRPHLELVQGEQDNDQERATEEVITGRLVDLPEDEFDPQSVFATITGRGEEQRNPILPAWMHSKNDFKATAAWYFGGLWYRFRFHAWRMPVYVLRMLSWAPVGAAKLLHKAWGWVWDFEQKPLRKAMLSAGDTNGYMRLVAQRNEHAKERIPGFLLGLSALAVSGSFANQFLPWQINTLIVMGIVMALSFFGRPADKPITGVAVTVTRYQKITAERVREALCTLGISGLKDPKKITFPTEIHRDGPGQLARINLPMGVEAIKVCEERGKLSSALRLPVDQVWPTAGPDHAGQVDLWVGYQPASKMKPPKWEIASDNARISVFKPVSFGADQRQRPVYTTFFERNWLIGGMPGSGKSYAARALALALSLDPTTEFKIAEFKGTGDFMDFEPICSEYICGVDDEAIEGGSRIIAWGLAEAERRGKKIKKYKKEGRAPEGKVTPELAAAGVGLHPVVILLDEVHELFLASKEAAAGAERLVKRGRALGIIVILATQIPDKDSLPPGVTRSVNMRWCLAVQDHIANDMILGTGSYKRGITGTSFRPGVDAGWGMVTGLESPSAVRSFYPSSDEAKKILSRAIQLRGGVVPTSEDIDQPRLDILYDVQRVWPSDRSGVQWQTLADLLSDISPELYGDMTADSVSALMRALGVPSEDVKAEGRNLKGCKRSSVEAAVQKRELTR